MQIIHTAKGNTKGNDLKVKKKSNFNLLFLLFFGVA